MTKVIDTNVPLVINSRDEHPSDLVDACEEIIEGLIEGRLAVVTDAGSEILDEYFHKLNWSGQPGLGDAFARYVFDNRFQWDPATRPDIEPDDANPNTYGVLEGDHDEIDPSDRKFVAVAKVSGAPIVQATDTKWLTWGAVLTRHDVTVEYAHEPSIRAAFLEKFGQDAP